MNYIHPMHKFFLPVLAFTLAITSPLAASETAERAREMTTNL